MQKQVDKKVPRRLILHNEGKDAHPGESDHDLGNDDAQNVAESDLSYRSERLAVWMV